MDEKIRVRATINLPGLPIGREALIDPADPYMADSLARGYLQRLPSGVEPTTEESVADAQADVVAPPEPEVVADD